MTGTVQDLLLHVAGRYPGKTAVIDGERAITYALLLSLQQLFARRLRDSLGSTKGKGIALFLPNCLEFVLGSLAVAEAGAVAIPLNIHLKERELLYYKDKYGIAAVITDSAHLPHWGSIPSQAPDMKFIIVDRLDLPKNPGDFPAHPHNPEKGSPDAEILYLSTSGSTGHPKIISRTHFNLITGAENVGEALGITAHDRFLSVTPFFHANGFANCMLLPLLKGASIIIMRQFSPRAALQMLRDNDITVLFGSPFIFSTLTDISDGPARISSLRLCISTGAPMPPGLRKTFFDKFGVVIRQLYGSSETGTISIQADNLTADEESLGRPLKNVDVKIVSADGRALPSREAGEIAVKSPAMTRGYVGESELNAKAFSDGYFMTGDTGMFDGKGNLYILGRKKTFINAAGVKVDPVEIENVLTSFHKVREAFVVGMKNKRGLEIIKAILVARPDCKVSEVMEYCRDKLADYKLPRIIEFKDKIPRDIMGKIVRHSQ